MKPNRPQSGFRHEDGFLLLGVLVMILVIMIALAVAAPKIADSIRRDKEQETIHRGKQYARAIQMYYNRYSQYPEYDRPADEGQQSAFPAQAIPQSDDGQGRLAHHSQW